MPVYRASRVLRPRLKVSVGWGWPVTLTSWLKVRVNTIVSPHPYASPGCGADFTATDLTVGASVAALVRTAPEGSDQALGVSPLSARTCTWYTVFPLSPVMVLVTPAPLCVKLTQLPLGASRYCTS